MISSWGSFSMMPITKMAMRMPHHITPEQLVHGMGSAADRRVHAHQVGNAEHEQQGDYQRVDLKEAVSRVALQSRRRSG